MLIMSKSILLSGTGASAGVVAGGGDGVEP